MGKFTIDTSITFVTRILQLLIGLGSSVIIARVLGPRGNGIYSLAILLPALLVIFGNFGIGQSSIFYVGKKKYSAKEILANDIIFSFLLGILGFLVGLIVILFLSDSIFPNVDKMYLFLALFLVPVRFFVSFVSYLLLGLQKIKEFNFINILQSFIFLVLISIFLLALKLSIKATIIANVLSFFIGAIALFYLAKRIIGNFYLHFNKSYFKDAFRYGVKVYLGNIIGFLHYRIDIFLVNIFLNPIAVGFYSVAVVLTEKIWLISQSAGTVLFPRVASETSDRNLKVFTPLICRNVLLIILVGAILLFFLSRWLIILVFSEKFLNSVLPFQILLIGAVTMGGWKILANDLYGRGKPELNIYISAMSVGLNVILNVIWIPKFGIIGAAWATSVSYSFAFVAIMIVYNKISGNNMKDILFVKKSDFKFYKNLIKLLKGKINL